MSKVIYIGPESAGKSLVLARRTRKIVDRNAKWQQVTGVERPIVSNLHYSESFRARALSKGVMIQQWKNLDELVGRRDCDIIIDEIGTYFDARLWTDLSLDVRRWIAQAAKLGVDIYGTAQSYAQVDPSFRRLVGELYLVRKIMGSGRPTPSRPPVKTIWGVLMMNELAPESMLGEPDAARVVDFLGIPKFMTISTKDTDIYDTRQQIDRSAPPPFRHVHKHCENPECTFEKILHV